MDGFGYSKSEFGNATLEATNIMKLVNSENTVFLKASGESVGLPEGQFGNSEVGHLTIGSGRVLKQKLPRINDAIKNHEIENILLLNTFFKNGENKVCHLMGLFSNGGVHSELNHFFWAIDFLRKRKIKIKAHLFLDGRDVGFRDAYSTLELALNQNKLNISEIATIQGRFYAMDRDKKLDRTAIAYDAITKGKAEYKSNDPLNIIQSFYDKGINDETIPPIIVNNYNGANKSDLFWMLNFRTDRIKQINKMILDKGFSLLNMVDCGEEIDSRAGSLFPTQEVSNTLGEVLAKNEISQLRIAETEKYAHVTYFFNGGKEIQYEKEDRILIPSPKVKDYSETPDMSANEITENLLKALEESKYQVIIANFANPDMIGHTGDFEATKQALRNLDIHIKELLQKAKETNYITILTADHGNAENMINEDGTPQKTHTCALVPFIVIPEIKPIKKDGTLADIAPTVLHMLELEKPLEMTGNTLIY